MSVKKLRDAVKFLNETPIAICEEHEDGRINSTTDEDTIILLLEEKYGKEDIEKPPARHWWDVKPFDIPVNIKSSTFTTADNFSSKQAVLYALTDLTEDEIKDLNDLQQQYADVQNLMGQLSMQKILLRQEKERLETSQEKAESMYESVQQKEIDLVNKLTNKYGKGRFNTEEGTFESDDSLPELQSDQE